MSKTKKVVTISISLIITGIIILSYSYIKEKINKAYEDMNISMITQTDNGAVDNTPQNVSKDYKEEKTNEDYIGILKINKINFERGFYKKESSLNNVDQNVTILSASDYPDKDKGNVILVAHSGSSYLGYFKNLYKLKIGNIASINYKNIEYTYKVTKIYDVKKTGSVNIYRNNNLNTLTLITCTKNSNTKQTVYILELSNKEKV